MGFPSNSIVGTSAAQFVISGDYSFPFGDAGSGVHLPLTLPIPFPGGIQDGDLLIAFVASAKVGGSGGNTHPITVPAGWHLFTSVNTNPNLNVLYRTADGTETGSVNFVYDLPAPTSNGLVLAGWMTAVRGLVKIPVFNAFTWSVGSNPQGPTTTVADAIILVAMFPASGLFVPTDIVGMQVLVNTQSSPPIQDTIAGWAKPFLGPGPTGQFVSFNWNAPMTAVVVSVVPGPTDIPVPPPIPPAPTVLGELIGLTYEVEQQVWGWHRHFTGQDLPTPDAFVSVCAIQDPTDEQNDNLWAVTSRLVGGQIVNFVEFFDPTLNTDAATETVFTSPVTSVSGLAYLSGRMVQIKADGSYLGTFVVPNSGTIDFSKQLPQGALDVEVGLPYTSLALTVRPEVGGGPGQSSQGVKVQWQRVFARVK